MDDPRQPSKRKIVVQVVGVNQRLESALLVSGRSRGVRELRTRRVERMSAESLGRGEDLVGRDELELSFGIDESTD
jgi:hypothetical protein